MSRPRQPLTKEQREAIAWAHKGMRTEEARYRRAVLRALREGVSFAEMSRFTGLSTNTLQRWKREGK